MPRPIPTPVLHFTRVEHLQSIIADGLLSDTRAQASGSLQIEVGDLGIKQRRRTRTVPVDPGGVVADYVPFYFAPRSPTMYMIDQGRVPSYQDGCDRIVYLVSTLERLSEVAPSTLVSDRNAAKAIAAFVDLTGDLDAHVSWALMNQYWWRDTDEEPDRKERRMAECLVYGVVPWVAFDLVVTKTEGTAIEARAALAAAGEATNADSRAADSTPVCGYWNS